MLNLAIFTRYYMRAILCVIEFWISRDNLQANFCSAVCVLRSFYLEHIRSTHKNHAIFILFVNLFLWIQINITNLLKCNFTSIYFSMYCATVPRIAWNSETSTALSSPLYICVGAIICLYIITNLDGRYNVLIRFGWYMTTSCATP